MGWLQKWFTPSAMQTTSQSGRNVSSDSEILALTKVVGVSRRNEDGTSRQKIASKLRKGDLLMLVHEKDNPADANALKVLASKGKQVGYLMRERAEEFVDLVDERDGLIAVVTEVTGGDARGGKPSYGVNIAIVDE